MTLNDTYVVQCPVCLLIVFCQVLAMSQASTFVRSVEISDDRIPAVILYTDRQLHDVRAFSKVQSYRSIRHSISA